MIKFEKYFCPIPGAENEADIVIFARKHWVAFLGQFFLSIVLFLVPILFLLMVYFQKSTLISGLMQNLILIGGSIYYLVIITFCFTVWISFYYDLFIVTKDSIIDITQEGFFGRKIAQLSLLRVQDVTAETKGILGTVFSFGDVLVETAGEKNDNFLLKSVPNPQEFAAKIMELHDKLLEKEGRKEDALEGEGVVRPRLVSDQSEHNIPRNLPPNQGELANSQLKKGGQIQF